MIVDQRKSIGGNNTFGQMLGYLGFMQCLKDKDNGAVV